MDCLVRRGAESVPSLRHTAQRADAPRGPHHMCAECPRQSLHRRNGLVDYYLGAGDGGDAAPAARRSLQHDQSLGAVRQHRRCPAHFQRLRRRQRAGLEHGNLPVAAAAPRPRPWCHVHDVRAHGGRRVVRRRGRDHHRTQREHNAASGVVPAAAQRPRCLLAVQRASWAGLVTWPRRVLDVVARRPQAQYPQHRGWPRGVRHRAARRPGRRHVACVGVRLSRNCLDRGADTDPGASPVCAGAEVPQRQRRCHTRLPPRRREAERAPRKCRRGQAARLCVLIATTTAAPDRPQRCPLFKPQST
eukprot:PhM_4_TR502/c1_g1_i1/m.101746